MDRLDELAEAARTDPAAADLLYQQLQGYLRRFMDPDGIQDTLLAVHRKLHAFEDRGPGSFLAWVRRIAYFVQKNAKNRERRDRRLLAAARVPPTPAMSIISRIEKWQQFEMLRNGMESLTAQHRRAIENELAGADDHTLATLERISEACARTVRSRARRRLRAHVWERMVPPRSRLAVGRGRDRGMVRPQSLSAMPSPPPSTQPST